MFLTWLPKQAGLSPPACLGNQVRNTGDIIDRGIQYLSGMMVENFKLESKNQEDDESTRGYEFPKVIGIWILGESVTDRLSAVNESTMIFKKNQMEDYQIASDKIRLFTIELQKFTPTRVDRRNMLEAWMTFLKNPMNDEARQIDEIHKAFDTLKEVSADEEIKEIYRLRRETEEGLISEMTVKTQKAKEEGEKIEIEKTARNLLKIGLSLNQISQATGFSIHEIELLR